MHDNIRFTFGTRALQAPLIKKVTQSSEEKEFWSRQSCDMKLNWVKCKEWKKIGFYPFRVLLKQDK